MIKESNWCGIYQMILLSLFDFKLWETGQKKILIENRYVCYVWYLVGVFEFHDNE